MAVGECSPLGVLAREPNRNPVLEERGVREGLGLTPVDPSVLDRLAAAHELLRQLRIDRETVRHGQELLVECAEPIGGDRGDHGVARHHRGGGGLRYRGEGVV